MFLPILIILVGLLFLLKNLGLVSADVWSILWPAAIILIGLSLLSKKHCCWHNHKDESTKT